MIVYLVVEKSPDPDNEPDLVQYETESMVLANEFFRENCDSFTHYIETVDLGIRHINSALGDADDTYK